MATINYTRRDLPDGSAAFLIGTNSDAFAERLQRAGNGHQPPTETPTPEQEDGETQEGGPDRDLGGPITRFTDLFSSLPMGVLEAVGLGGHEIADAVQTRVNELYRNEFPIPEPRFERKCIECDAEFEERVEVCPECDGDVREPDPEERRRAEALTESVNKEGQSLRDLAKASEFDQWFTGVPVIVIRYDYLIAPPSTDGQFVGEAILDREPIELVKGDPRRIVPVVDENRRIGGFWWVCPRCRHDPDHEPAREDGFCKECGTRLEEVYFAEYGERHDDVEKYYFREEVVTFPWAFPRLNGLDGLSPVHHIWLKQLIIEFQDSYAAAFYDPDSDRLPNQFMILHTTNPDAWDELLNQARQNAKEDEYDSPVFTMEYAPEAGECSEVQVVDAMPDELLGQNGELKDTFKKDIRQAIGISDVHDSEMEDAGGLNNEGLQLEVTDRSLATQMHDYTVGWLDTLAKRLGLEDHKYGYLPATGPDAEDLQREIEAGIRAEEGGLDARLVGGRTEVADGEFDPEPPQPEGGFGGGGIPMADEQGGDTSNHDYGPDVEPLQKAGREDLEQVADVLFEAHQHMVYPDLVEQKAREPFWDDDEAMPEMVKQALREALRAGAITQISTHLSAGTTRTDVRRFFEEKLEQPQGWSLRSLTEDYSDRFGVPEDKAAVAVRRQTKSALDNAREIAFEAQGDTDDREFKWIGPIDDRKTQASWDVLEATNPDHGGTPRPLDELEQIVAEARREHFPKLTGAKWADGWQDRDTYVEHFD